MHDAPPPASQVRLSDLPALSVPVAWHEAVAVVRVVASHVLSDSRVGLPDAEHVWLGHDGSVRLEASGMQAFGRAREADPELTLALSTMLGALLPESAPAGLAALADSGNSEIRATAPAKFIEALTFFARPDDKAEIKALAERAAAAREASVRSQALQELTERARHARPDEDAAVGPARKSLNARPLKVAAAAVLLLALLTAGAWMLAGGAAPAAAPKGGAVAAEQSVAQRVQQGVASAAAFVKESLGGAPAVPAGRGADLELPRAKRRRSAGSDKQESAQAADTFAAATEPLPSAAIEVPGRGGAPPQRDLPSLDGTQHVLAAAPHGVYSAAHPDVIPPALERAQMPEALLGGLPIEQPGVLELVVDQRGQVLSAKLVPASNRHQDRMIVSAAKTWRFTPATRNGEPVRYRVHMPITW